MNHVINVASRWFPSADGAVVWTFLFGPHLKPPRPGDYKQSSVCIQELGPAKVLMCLFPDHANLGRLDSASGEVREICPITFRFFPDRPVRPCVMLFSREHYYRRATSAACGARWKACAVVNRPDLFPVPRLPLVSFTLSPADGGTRKASLKLRAHKIFPRRKFPPVSP